MENQPYLPSGRVQKEQNLCFVLPEASLGAIFAAAEFPIVEKSSPAAACRTSTGIPVRFARMVEHLTI